MREVIRDRGPQPFSWFMEQALYHPQRGYYSSGKAAIGRGGDYFTNVSVGPLFGTLLAGQFIEIWERLRRPGRRGDGDDFIIVEQGAHDGQFAHDVLSAIRARAPEMFEALRYRILETFSILQNEQSNTLREFSEKVSWRKSLAEVEPFVGVHFSNELLDAMPVDLCGKLVGLDGDKFVFVEERHGESAPNQAQLNWIDDVAAKLERGFVIAIDYGFSTSDFHQVVQARAKHRLLDSPFEQIGDSDISVHINWTDIARRAETNGLQVAGFTDQHHFLMGIIDLLGRGGSPEPPDEFGFTGDWGQSLLPLGAKGVRELQTLLHPEMLGRAFQVLGLAKHFQLAERLAGFRFARDPRSTLELET
jgi:SAM-dependent MidA family methyltransferase